jgi:hypothetical protein
VASEIEKLKVQIEMARADAGAGFDDPTLCFLQAISVGRLIQEPSEVFSGIGELEDVCR